jgi:hypothetical protein
MKISCGRNRGFPVSAPDFAPWLKGLMGGAPDDHFGPFFCGCKGGNPPDERLTDRRRPPIGDASA